MKGLWLFGFWTGGVVGGCACLDSGCCCCCCCCCSNGVHSFNTSIYPPTHYFPSILPTTHPSICFASNSSNHPPIHLTVQPPIHFTGQEEMEGWMDEARRLKIDDEELLQDFQKLLSHVHVCVQEAEELLLERWGWWW